MRAGKGRAGQHLWARLVISGLMVPIVAGCDPAIDTPAGGEPQRATPLVFASEAWATYAPASEAGAATLVVQYNDFQQGSFFGWSWSEDGRNWATCNATLPECGPGGLAPLVPPLGMAYRGDPAIAARRDGSGVVLASELLTSVDSNGEPSAVGVMLSMDGGRTFESVTVVNDDGPCGDVPGDVAIGRSDQQAIAWDEDLDVFYVAWRQSSNGLLGNYGACIRAGTVDRDARAIVWLDNAHSLGAGGIVAHIGGLHLAAGGGNVMFAYTDPTDGLSCTANTRASLVSRISSDLGRTWTLQAITTVSNGGCVGSSGFTASHRGFGIARGRGNQWWLVAQRDVDSLSVMAFNIGVGGPYWDIVRTDPWPADEDVVGVLFPTIAIDDDGRIGISFTTAASDGTFVRRFAGTAPGSNFFLMDTLGTPFDPTGLGSRFLGDFDVMTTVGSDAAFGGATFLSVWAQTETLDADFGGFSEVVSQLVRVNRP